MSFRHQREKSAGVLDIEQEGTREVFISRVLKTLGSKDQWVLPTLAHQMIAGSKMNTYNSY